jgi:hypothetical protein
MDITYVQMARGFVYLAGVRASNAIAISMYGKGA